jgi:hypothetical protein
MTEAKRKRECRGHRKDGTPCGCHPVRGQKYCRWHIPADKASSLSRHESSAQAAPGYANPSLEDDVSGHTAPAGRPSRRDPNNEDILVGVVHINARGSDQLDAALCDLLERLLKDRPLGVHVEYFTATNALKNAVAGAPGRVVLFSNFPPDSSYAQDPVVTERVAAGGGVITSFAADSYEKTKAFYSSLLSAHPAVELHVITGAPFERLTNFEITSVGLGDLVTVQRKSEWLYQPDYPQRYADYVIKTLGASLARQRGAQSYDRSRIYASQFSRLSILVLCDQANRFAVDVTKYVLEACGQMSFHFNLARSVEDAHSTLINSDVDGLLVIDIPGNWFPILDTLAASNQTMAVFYLTTAVHELSNLPQNVATYYLEPHASKDFRELLDAFLAAIEQLRAVPANVDVRQHVLKRFFQILSEDCEESFARANRYLVRVQHLLLGALSREKGLLAFTPFDSLRDFQDFAHVLPFVAPYSVATYTNPLDFEYESEARGGLKVSKEPFAIQMLWDLPRRRYGFLSPSSLPGFLRDYSDLFEAGGVQFFPSPMLTQVTPENVEELQPTAYDVLRRMGDRPYMMLNTNPSDYFPAAGVGAQFGCSDTPVSQVVAPSLLRRLEIPYISAANPRELAKLLRDEETSIRAFRDHVSDAIEDCNRGLGREDTSTILRRFGKELTAGVALLDDRIRRLKRTNRIGLVAGTVLTATVVVSSAFGLAIPKTVVAAAGTGGGIGVLTHLLNYTNEIRNYRQERLYFLWRLSLRRSGGA